MACNTPVDPRQGLHGSGPRGLSELPEQPVQFALQRLGWGSVRLALVRHGRRYVMVTS